MGYDDPDPTADAQRVTSDEAVVLRSLGAMSTFELAAARYRDTLKDQPEPEGPFADLIGGARYDRRALLLTLTSALAEIAKLRQAARELAAIEEATHGQE